jgi:hypothetical protein
MPQSSDDPPSAPTVSVESETPNTTAVDPPEGANRSDPPSPDSESFQPRRRRRRRRRRPPPAAASQGTTTANETAPEETLSAGGEVQDTQVDSQGDAQPPKPRRHRRRRRGPPRDVSQQSPLSADVPVDESGQPDPKTVTPGEDATQAQPAPGVAGEPTRPRRRRRRPARRPGPMEQTDSGGQTQSGSVAITDGTFQSQPGTVGRPWPNRPRNRRPRDPVARAGGNGPRQPRERAAGPPDAVVRGRRDQGSDTRGRQDRRSPGRSREAPLKKLEQKLYALESVVDRGFEDVADDSNEGSTRRVHWTILKRTVADQKSGKAMSASYVLQREGVEAEFPNLGAARAAVNKTIVHPEKLTLSKAEHVAAKGSR